jgi:UrcA family protein
MSTSTATAVLASAFLAIGIGSAYAADQDISVIVKYGDLDISTPDGAKSMLQRIVQAARRVCAPDANLADLPGLGDWLKYCVSTRVSGTVSRLGAPIVTAAYRSRATRPSTDLSDPRSQ